MKKQLYFFYCLDCDNAWTDLFTDEFPVSKCEYCGALESPEKSVE